MVDVTLSAAETRLVRLALAYHFGRPGSEPRADAGEAPGRGLAAVRAIVERGPEADGVAIGLDAWQMGRLASALKGSVTELRLYHMRDGAVSSVAGWTEAAERLFPALRADGEHALELAEAVTMLERRLRGAG